MVFFLRRLQKDLRSLSNWSNNLYRDNVITDEEVEALSATYAKRYISRFKKVAEQAYKDGLRDALAIVQKKTELDNSEFDYGHNVKHYSDE